MSLKKQMLATIGFAAIVLTLGSPAGAQGFGSAIQTFTREVSDCQPTFASSGWYDGLNCENSALLEFEATVLPTLERMSGGMIYIAAFSRVAARRQAIADAVERGNMSKEDGLDALERANRRLIQKLQAASAHGDLAR